eukprot:2134672-Pleurochrysis_carterae.AAC.2
MGGSDAGNHGKGNQELYCKRGFQCGDRSMDQQNRKDTKRGRRDISGDLGGPKPGSLRNGRLHIRKSSDTDR